MNQDNNINQNNQNLNNIFNQPVNNQNQNINQQQPQPQELINNQAINIQTSYQEQPTQIPQQPLNNTIESTNVNNRSLNAKPPKKKKLGLIIGIVFILLIIIISIIMGSKIITKQNDNNNPTSNINDSEIVPDQPIEEEVDLSSWGQEDTIWTYTSNNSGLSVLDGYSIRVPKYTGAYHMYARISEQGDDTAVLLSGQYVNTPTLDEESKVFSTYVDYTIESLKDLYGVRSENYHISIDTSEPITIGDHDMYVHTGTITFDYSKKVRSYQYVAYATLMKDSGNSAYWMVYDISEEQSNGELIAEHALKMAKTFREKE